MKQQPRWWVVVGAIVVGWVLTCVGPVAGQTVRGDSALLRSLAQFRQAENYDAVLCIRVAVLDTLTIRVDSIIAVAYKPPCPQGTNGFMAAGPEDLPDSVFESISLQLLTMYPEFSVVCALMGAEYAKLERGIQTLVPRFNCLVRK